MKAIILSVDEYQTILGKLEVIDKKLSEKHTPQHETWLSNTETAKFLKVSCRTLQNYRDKGLLEFSQVKGKIYFRLSHLESHLNKHNIKAIE